jgi:hypothetical protein
VKVPATDFAKYTLVGRTAEYDRKQIREALKFRPSTVAYEKAPAEWLAAEVCPVELVEDRQREALLVECRARKVERPLPLAARRDEHLLDPGPAGRKTLKDLVAEAKANEKVQFGHEAPRSRI